MKELYTYIMRNGMRSGVLALLWVITLFTQNLPAQSWEVGNIWPEEPHAAKLRKVTMAPPALSTGAVTFQVPLYDIKVEDLVLPLGLRYHSNGIQIDEDPYPVGYGWSLLPAFRITRQVFGRPDGKGYEFVGDKSPSEFTHAELQRCMVDYAQLGFSKGLDAEKDLFTVHMPEGTFTGIYENGEILMPGHMEYKVTCSTDMMALEVSDPKGRIWKFDKIGAWSKLGAPSEWSLSKIILPSGKTISIEWNFGFHNPPTSGGYQPCTLYYPTILGGWTPYVNSPLAGYDATVESPASDKSLNPVSITFPGGKVEFSYNGGNTPTTLSEMKVSSTIGSSPIVVEKVTLTYGSSLEDRTMLEKVTFMDGNTYVFGYNPERFVGPGQTDYWGYYNRGGSGHSNAPAMSVSLPSPTSDTRIIEGSDRRPSTQYMQARLLTSVTYPTGGICEWEYEPHRFEPVDFADGPTSVSTQEKITFGGGVRVTKQTMRKSQADNQPYVVEYFYGELDDNGNCDGKAVVDVYPTATTFLSSIICVTGSVPSPYPDSQGWPGPVFFGVVSASPWSTYRDYRIGEETIWYPRVEERHPEGKVVHVYEKWVENDVVATSMEGVRPFSIQTAFGAGVFESTRTEYEVDGNGFKTVRQSEWDYLPTTSGVDIYYGTSIRRKKTQSSTELSPDFPKQKDIFLGNCTYSYGEQDIYEPRQYTMYPYVMELQSVTETEYTQNGPIERWKSYDYKSNTGILTSESLTDGTDILTHEYLYPFNTSSAVSTAMMAANQQGICVGERLRYGSAVSQHLMEYARIGSGTLFRPIRETASRGNSSSWTVATYEWNTDGTLKSNTGADGIKTTYTWDSAGLYPLSMSIGGKLQRKLTWIPLVGVASMTDEAGLVTSFSYDTGRRLKEIRKGGRLLERYEYAVSQSGDNSLTTRTHTSASGSHMTRSRLDGLGREWATYTELPGGGVVTLTEYDAMGRQYKGWFPAPGTASMTESQIRSAAISFHSDSAPWEERSYRRAPAEELLKVMRGGEAWLEGGHVSRREVVANGVPEYSHLMQGITQNGVEIKGMTPAGRVRWEILTDEDGMESSTLTDLRGLKLRETKNNRGVSYVYDDYGDLRYVLPSGAPSVGKRTDSDFEATVYWYDYDSRGRMTLSHIPGTRAARYIYDPADRLVAEQSADHPDGMWRVYAYDECGRKVVVADCDITDAQAAAFGSVCRTATTTGSGSWGGYDLRPAPSFTPDELDFAGIWFYDTYSFIATQGVGSNFLYTNPSTIPGFSSRLPKGITAPASSSSANGKLTGYNTGKGWEVYYYDSMGQLCQTVSSGYNTGRRMMTYNYDLSVASEHTVYGGAFPDTDTYHSYDAAGRPVETLYIQLRNEGNTEKPDTALFRTFYDAIGRVERAQTGPLTTTHTYDVHGWLRTTSTKDKVGVPRYTQMMMYADGKTPLWNGRISAREWSQGTGPTMRYDYTYDSRGYLTKASFSGQNQAADHSTAYSYDVHGNLTTLRRQGVTDIPPSSEVVYGLLDAITATFSGVRPTRLTVESDAETFLSRTGIRKEGDFSITYDFAGRLVADESRGIESTTYDSDGLVLGMETDDGGRYTYERDGAGNMLSSTILVPTVKGERIVKFRQYTGNGHIIVDDSLKMTRFPGGYFTPDGGVYYNVTDYQGNICKVVRSDGTVCQSMDYYPYGEPFSEWNWDRAEINSSMSSNRYLFNGNERETGLGVNMYDFNARNYVASYPLFGRPDPKCRKFPWLNPYSFCGGDPVNNVDPTGMEINMTSIMLYDQNCNQNITQSVIEDLIVQTGLQLSLNEDNILQYAKDENGNPIVSKTTDKDGNEIESGSKSARKLLVNAIDDKYAVPVSYTNRGSKTTKKEEIGLDPNQINGFIKGAEGVDGNTLGFGMTFLHELHHTPLGGDHPDELFDYGTGPVVDRMNVIRSELNKQGFNYGQRMSYSAFPTDEGSAMPFNTKALRALQSGSTPGKNAQYIKNKN